MIEALHRLEARRAILVSEPGAWAAFGAGVAEGLRAEGWAVELVMLPAGEAAKELSVIGEAARELARLRAERRDPLVADRRWRARRPGRASWPPRTSAACR